MRRLPWPQIVLALALSVAFGISFTHHPLNSDEGTTLSAAWDIYRGLVPYRDTFEYVAPGSAYAIAAWWQLTGASYLHARLLALLLLAASGWLLASAAWGAQSKVWPPVVLAAVYYWACTTALQPVVNHNVFFVLPGTLVVLLALRWFCRLHWASHLALGLACGLACSVLQHKGLLMLAALAAATVLADGAGWRRRGAAVAALLVGCTLALLPMLALADVAVLWWQLVEFPGTRYLAVQHVGSLGWLVGAVLVVAWLWWPHLCRAGWRRQALWPVCCIQVLLLASALQRADFFHLLLACFPSLVLAGRPPSGALRLPVWLQRFLNAPRRPWPAVAQPVLQGGRLLLWAGGLSLAFVYALGAVQFYSKLRGQRLVEQVVAQIEAACGQDRRLFAWPFAAALYVETQRVNPTRYSHLIDGFNTDAQFEDAARALARSPPPCVVGVPHTAARFGHTGRNAVDDLIRREYSLHSTAHGVQILRRREPAD